MTKRSGSLSRVGNRPLSTSAWERMCVSHICGDPALNVPFGHATSFSFFLAGRLCWDASKQLPWGYSSSRNMFLLLLSLSQGYPYRNYVFIILRRWWCFVAGIAPDTHYQHMHWLNRAIVTSETIILGKHCWRCDVYGPSLNVSQIFFGLSGSTKTEERLLIQKVENRIQMIRRSFNVCDVRFWYICLVALDVSDFAPCLSLVLSYGQTVTLHHAPLCYRCQFVLHPHWFG